MMSRAALAMRQIAMAVLVGLAIALPWELLQRIPFTSTTLAKVLGGTLVLLALFTWICEGAAIRRLPRPGLAGYIVFFLYACIASYVFSADQAATLFQFRVYVTYFLSFYAICFFVDSIASARRLMLYYLASSIGVAAITILCFCGLLWPAFWQTASWSVQPLLLEWRSGVIMRMAAVSADLNQGVVPLLVAAVIGLYVYPARAADRRRRLAWGCIQIVLATAILISMSRSALLLLAALYAWYGLRHFKRTHIAFGAGTFLLIGFAAYVALPELSTSLIARVAGGGVGDAGSIEGRAQVYRLALAVLPRYYLLGCGLGASDAALASSTYAKDAIITIHSVPLKFSIEIGVWGLLAYLLLVWIGMRRLRAAIAGSETADASDLYRATLVISVLLFLFTCIQPFPYLPSYPLLAGLAFGPLARMRRGSNLAQSPVGAVTTAVRRIAIVVPCAVVCAIGVNCALYQQCASAVERYCDALRAGSQAESRGQYLAALEAYGRAWFIGKATEVGGAHRFLDDAKLVVDTYPYTMEIGIVQREVSLPGTAAFAAARVAISMSDAALAEKWGQRAFDAGDAFDFLAYDLAEFYWQRGEYASAFPLYAKAAAVAVADVDLAELRRIGDVERRMPSGFRSVSHYVRAQSRFSEQMLWLNGRTHLIPQFRRVAILNEYAKPPSDPSPSEPTLAARAQSLRRLGQWPDAVATYREILARFPNSAIAREQIAIADALGE